MSYHMTPQAIGNITMSNPSSFSVATTTLSRGFISASTLRMNEGSQTGQHRIEQSNPGNNSKDQSGQRTLLKFLGKTDERVRVNSSTNRESAYSSNFKRHRRKSHVGMLSVETSVETDHKNSLPKSSS